MDVMASVVHLRNGVEILNDCCEGFLRRVIELSVHAECLENARIIICAVGDEHDDDVRSDGQEDEDGATAVLMVRRRWEKRQTRLCLNEHN